MSEQEDLAGRSEELAEPEDVVEDEQGLPEAEVTTEEVEEVLSEAQGAAEEGEEAPIEAEEMVETAAEPDILQQAEDVIEIDLNTATEEELQQLHGIGQALAARIVDYRDEVGLFKEPAEITEVPGVSEAMYLLIADRLTVSGVEPALDDQVEPVELEVEDEEPLEPEEELEVAEEPVAAEPEPEVAEAGEKPPPGPEPPLVEVVETRVGCWPLLLVGVLSTILGAALALVMLFALNGTLDFQEAAVLAVQDEVQRLEAESDTLSTQMASVEGRLEEVENLGSQLTDARGDLLQLTDDLGVMQAKMKAVTQEVDGLRAEYTNLREDMDGVAGQVSALGTRVDDVEQKFVTRVEDLEQQLVTLNQEMKALDRSVQRFDAFLDGLLELLMQSGGVESGEAPPRRIAPGATVEQTPGLQPMVTVIPLATPTPTPTP